MSIEEVFVLYHRKQKEFEISIDEMKKDIGPYLNKIVLYGAGSAGIAFIHYLNDAGVFPIFFADGDEEKHGKHCEGLEIIAPDQIVEKAGKDALIIVTINTDGKHYCRDFKTALLSGGHQGVHKALEEVGCAHIIDYVYFRKCFGLFDGGKYNLPACSDVHLMAEHERELKDVYEILTDEQSKEIFLKLLEFRMLDDAVRIPTISEEKQYFEYDLFPKIQDEVFIDCGACGGSSLKIFLEENKNQFERYYGFEPDPYNYNRLKKYIENLPKRFQPKMICYPKAVFDQEKGTNFFVLGGPGTFAADIGTEKVETITIDTALEGKKATFIKMNIEGSEIPALKGAKETIRKYKPRMAIMGYHKTSDLWEVPLLIKKYNPEYKIYLKSYMENVAFCYFCC